MRSATGKSMPSNATTTCCALRSPPLSGNPTGSCTRAQLSRVIMRTPPDHPILCLRSAASDTAMHHMWASRLCKARSIIEMPTLGYLLLKCVSTVQAAAISSATLSASSVVEWRFLMACRSQSRS